MENRDQSISKKIDLSSLAIIGLFFILVIAFSYLGPDKNPINIFLVFIVMVGTIVGYYTNFIVAILYSIIFIFFYASIHIFNNITRGIPIGGEVYLWMVLVPSFAFILAYYGGLIRNIQEQNNKLRQENAEFVLVDKDTGLLSAGTFFNELQAFMKINERYDIEVYLLLVKIKYENEVIKILGEAKYNKMVNEVSKAISSMLREEDKKYILRDVNMFGIILLSNKDGGKYVKDRIKEAITSINFGGDAVIDKIQLEVLVGVAVYNPKEIKNPYEFFKMAEKDMEYDV